MGNVSIKIDLSLGNIWNAWFSFKRGKKISKELDQFTYYLEDNLWRLCVNLNEGRYVHGTYRQFTIQDGKRRKIAVAEIRDRVVHRLVYEHLDFIYDKTFIYDLWSCRKNKGLQGAISRTEKFLAKYRNSFIWRADIIKFFDNVKQDVLMEILGRRIKDNETLRLINEIIGSYACGGVYEREEQTSEEFQLVILLVKFSPIFT